MTATTRTRESYVTAILNQNTNAIDQWINDSQIPTISLQAPAMPPPGPNFLRLMNNLASSDQSTIQTLYDMALYQNWFTLDVNVKAKLYPVTIVPGHTWSSTKADGPRQKCKVMVIGKMPGLEELRARRNWVGKSGNVFMDALERVGVEPNEYRFWYVTNVLKYGHPTPWLGNAIQTDWLKDCRPLLQMELRLVQPDFILCLGSEAGKELFDRAGTVTNSTGRVHEYTIQLPGGGTKTAKAMVCIHPAAVARTPDLQPQMDSSLRMFWQLVQGKASGVAETDLDHIVVDNEDMALAAIIMMMKETASGGAIAVDCEWQGEIPTEPGSWLRTIQVSHKPKFALCLVIRGCGGTPKLLNSKKVKLALNMLFESRSDRHIRAVGHFHRADLPWLIHYGLDIRKQFEAPENKDGLGWLLTKDYGGFDTGMAAHAVCETDDYKLEVLATRYTGCMRYDIYLQQAKKDLCKLLKIKADDLPGYGDIPDNVLYPYANYDVDVTRRLFDVYNGVGDKPGLLDCDEYGNNSRVPFYISMRASPACLEIEQTGLMVDMSRASEMLNSYRTAKAYKLVQLRKDINWDRFNPDSPFDMRELLFGPQYRGQVDKATGNNKRASPPEARLLYLQPVKATGKATKKAWQDLVSSNQASMYSPATDKETLGILFHTTEDRTAGHLVETLRDIKFLGQLLKTTLKPPTTTKEGLDATDEDGNPLYEKGLLSYVSSDKRIRTHVFQTLETGRWASARPNLTNISKRREADYKRILASNYIAPLRTIFIAPSGYVFIEADYVGAELAGMAWMSGDLNMIEHVRRAQLPEDHPDYYDLHSAVAVAAFRLKCPPTKAGLDSINMLHLRIAAKNVMFGYAYGRGAQAIARQAKEEGIILTVEEAQALIDGLIAKYPMLPIFFNKCRERVKKPGWICNCFGRIRRFRLNSDDYKVLGELERQALNTNVQSLVADAISRSVDHLYSWPNRTFKIALQIHDALLLEVPIKDIEYVHDVVLPECMTTRVDIWPCDLDGVVMKHAKEPYHLGIDREVMTRWGAKLYKDECQQLGIPERFGKTRK